MSYNVILYFRLPYFHVSNCALFCTSVLSFYIDVGVTLSIHGMRFQRQKVITSHRKGKSRPPSENSFC